jgi:KinB signaling pathway activation protein
LTIRKWIYLFWTTLLLGTVAALLTGIMLVLMFPDFSVLENSKAGFDLQSFAFIILAGATVSMLSEMGFFSYMIVRYIGMGVLRSKLLWDILQLALILITVFDYIYLNYSGFAKPGETVFQYAALPIALLLVALIVAFIKAKQTNWNGFIPTLFFMYVVTVLEAVQALRLNSFASSIFMLVPLIACNAWQILMLHRLVKKEGEPST